MGKTSKHDALPMIVCDREGQVLFDRLAPPDLQMGAFLTDRLSAADTRFFKENEGRQHALYVLRGRPRRAALLYPAMFGTSRLLTFFLLAASPGASAAAAHALGVMLSPGMAAIAERGGERNIPSGELDAAYMEITRLTALETEPVCGGQLTVGAGYSSCAALIRRIAQLAPLWGCRVRCDAAHPLLERTIHFDERLFGGIFLCLARFLYRFSVRGEISLRLYDGGACPEFILSAEVGASIPVGASSLSLLERCFSDAPELILGRTLAMWGGIPVACCGTADGQLCFSLSPVRVDPSLQGLKQRPVNGEATEEAEEEWCRLLRRAVLKET